MCILDDYCFSDGSQNSSNITYCSMAGRQETRQALVSPRTIDAHPTPLPSAASFPISPFRCSSWSSKQRSSEPWHASPLLTDDINTTTLSVGVGGRCDYCRLCTALRCCKQTRPGVLVVVVHTRRDETSAYGCSSTNGRTKCWVVVH